MKRKDKTDILKLGVRLNTPSPDPKYKDDLIHPSVLYIPNGFGGSKWWMVGTPYPGYNNQLENPILYKGDSNTEIPPINWTPTSVVAEVPLEGGYNSDPALYFDGTKLWVFWRENGGHLLNRRSIFVRSTTDGINFSDRRIICDSLSVDIDYAIAPAIYKDIDGKIKLIAPLYELRPARQNRGLAIWPLNGTLETGKFELYRTSAILAPEGFDTWHGDIFIHNDVRYYVATPESGIEVCIAKSYDGLNFQFCARPLISNAGSGAMFFYKPCARVVANKFYLWHPALVSSGSHRIYMDEGDITEVMANIDKDFSRIY